MDVVFELTTRAVAGGDLKPFATVAPVKIT
jgi:hypothetical protein